MVKAVESEMLSDNLHLISNRLLGRLEVKLNYIVFEFYKREVPS